MSALIKKGSSLAVAVAKDATKTTTTVQSSDTETLIICIDCSGSMRDRVEGAQSKMHAAIDAASSLVRSCGILSHVGAVAFHDCSAEVLSPATGRGKLIESLGGFHKHEGGTQFSPCLRSALNEIATHRWGGVKRIIFMSDGEDLGLPESLWAVVRECADAKIIIDTVMFGYSPEGEKTLREMAAKTGGVFCLAKDAASLRRTFLSLEAGARGLLTGGKK